MTTDSSNSRGLQIGAAEVDITPPEGTLMAAFPERPHGTICPRRAAGTHDSLNAKALAISDGKTSVCVCACDVTLWQREDVEKIRRAVTERCDVLPPENIILVATHTHSSGENTYLFKGDPQDEWVVGLREKTVRVIVMAMNDLAESRVFFAQVEAPYNHNRRVPGDDGIMGMSHEYKQGVTLGPTDPTLSVLRFDRDDGSQIIWSNWTGHGVTVGPLPNKLFSADYPGVLARFVEERRLGSSVIFTNGAAGNIHPHWCMREGFDAAEKVGELLGQKVIEALESAEEIASVPLRLINQTLEFPNRADTNLTAACQVACLHLGNMRIGFLPGEPYVQFQLRFRQALQPHPVFISGYANAWVGYVPTEQDFDKGGYGVDFYPNDPPLHSRTMLECGCGEKMLQTLIEAAR